jgi:hypothetical protein
MFTVQGAQGGRHVPVVVEVMKPEPDPVAQRGRPHALLAQPAGEPVGVAGGEDDDVGQRTAAHPPQAGLRWMPSRTSPR